mmetsp:Transcript_42527/g.136777  ORF Transcript_42527/g.136777 Transcript_42527/m.136777 type:complete len:200 (+) Transcript_42527:108-707(+)
MQTPQYPEVHIAQYPEQHDLCHPPPPQPAVATATPIAVARPVPAVAAAASPSQPMLPAEEQLSTCSGKVSLGGGDALPARLRLGGCSAHYVIDTRAMQWPGDSAALVLAPACGGLCCCGAFCASDLTLVVAPDTAVRTYASGCASHTRQLDKRQRRMPWQALPLPPPTRAIEVSGRMCSAELKVVTLEVGETPPRCSVM